MKTETQPPTGRFLRDVIVVAGHELADSIRTKRAILLMILFGGFAVIGTAWFIKFLKSVETQLVQTLGLDSGASGGATAALWKSNFFREMITHMVGDKDLAQSLLMFTPIGLYFGWLSMTFAPWLVALTSSSRVTEEIWSGSARFVLCRTTRFAWMLGKYLGQALQLLAALMLCAVASWLTGRFMLESFDSAGTLHDMLLFAPKAWVYGLAFLGLVSGISMFCKSPGIANVLGIVGFLAVTVVYYLAGHYAGEGWRRIFDAVQIVLPRHHYFDLMRPDWGHALPAVIFVTVLGLAYLMIGYARLAKGIYEKMFDARRDMTNALEIRGLRKSYGKCRALDGLDLTVQAGSIFGLVGANGAGKTTLMSICCGLLRADGGDVNLLGDGGFDSTRHAGRVTILPQDSRLPLHARVTDLLLFYGHLQGVPKSQLRGQIAQLLAWVNLSDRAKSPVKNLSHGMMRRLTVAQAFLGEPQLIFLDEPMSGLDPREVVRMRDLLLQRRGKQTIVISSHVLTELEALCDTIAFIDKGRLLKQDSLQAIVRHHHRITYRIRPGGPVPLDSLRDAVIGASWNLSNDGTELSALLVDGAGELADINAKVLTILLQSGVGIVEVRRGSDLESEFLAATKG